MSIEKIATVVVGGGQAGLAMSEHLSNNNEPHVVLERHRIAERWRTERWDSLMTNGPVWHDRFPTLEFADVEPDGFASRQQVTDYFVSYARQINAPVRCGVEVTRVSKADGCGVFRVETSDGVIEANNVVAATGPFQRPIIPPIIPQHAAVEQIHSNNYRNPEQLPDGAVLVVGAGSSGTQIADELQRAGRRVYLSVGPHDRPPRWYRGQDFVWWLGVLGKWDNEKQDAGREHVTISVSGAYGGQTIDFRRLAAQGITLTGMTASFADNTLQFAPDLLDNLASGDANYLSVLDEADAFVARNGLSLPEDPAAREVLPDPDCVSDPLKSLNLADAGVTSVIWATGYAVDYRWLEADVVDAQGKPVHQRGVTAEPGLYFLGLPWQSRRGSAFIWGVWHDAKFLADQIVKQRTYMDYLASSQRHS